MHRESYVYLLANKHNNVLYAGVTNDLIRRVYEHKSKLVAGFTQKYNVDRLVYYEACPDIVTAIAREKQIKGWVRHESALPLVAESATGKARPSAFRT